MRARTWPCVVRCWHLPVPSPESNVLNCSTEILSIARPSSKPRSTDEFRWPGPVYQGTGRYAATLYDGTRAGFAHALGGGSADSAATGRHLGPIRPRPGVGGDGP